MREPNQEEGKERPEETTAVTERPEPQAGKRAAGYESTSAGSNKKRDERKGNKRRGLRGKKHKERRRTIYECRAIRSNGASAGDFETRDVCARVPEIGRT